ncbi:hypothetical protein [Thioalkalivibrio sp. ALE28]|uniref:hypothetical protein n=1 Tax=Thioalkalivibrio sp. ALE28 TaxID=1158179 RepID=UPI0003679D0A|nr:hypothetical protein [Thioalkalivibrio sp. ALE28]
MTTPAAHTTSSSARAGLWLCMTLLASLALLWLASQHEPRDWDADGALTLQLGEQRYQLDHQRLTALERYTLEWLEAGDTAAREHWQTRVDAELEARFAALHDRVPEVVDGYYSLGAEYTRLWRRGVQWLGDAAPDAGARMLREQLLPDALWDEPLRELATRVEWGLDEQQRQVRDAWRLELIDRLADARIPNPPPRATATSAAEIERGHALHTALDIDLERFDQRTGLAATAAAGSGLATPLIARAVQARLAARTTQAGLARSLGRAGRAGALGAGVCAWSGPFSLGCGITAAGATIIGVDWLLLRLDEARHREALEQALHEALDALEAETRQALQQAIAERVEARHAASRSAVENTFQPWRGPGPTSGVASGDGHGPSGASP